MSRKHFQAMAQKIALISETEARRQAADAFATVAAMSNPRFNRARFMAACGL